MNRGYQKDDINIIDYQLWSLPKSLGIELDVKLRGPARGEFPERYAVALGAAQTFGRFVENPYPILLENELNLPVINLGVSGAGPSYFLKRSELLEIVNRAQFAIVQVLSGRSISNEVFITGENQGLLIRRDNSGQKAEFAEDAYTRLIKEMSPEELIRLRVENRSIYIEEMRELLMKIKVPKILMYFSKRKVKYDEGIGSIGTYWGDFPHFVNQGVIDALKPYAECYVEVVSARGLPQPLFDKKSKLPVLMWPERKFPNVKLRHHNHYYPSPEMHLDAFKELLPAIKSRHKWKAALPQFRNIIYHMHIFKNAGSSVDESLQKSFGSNWREISSNENINITSDSLLASIIKDNPNIVAISSHEARPPVNHGANYQIFPIVFIRHPLDRIASIYSYERSQGRKDTCNDLHTIKANELNFKDFIKWALSNEIIKKPISNFQVLSLSRLQISHPKERWSLEINEGHLKEALSFLGALPVVGIVDEFDRSISAFSKWLKPHFLTLELESIKVNSSARDGMSLSTRLKEMRDELGDAVYNQLLSHNALDLFLYETVKNKLAATFIEIDKT